eukprot:CAMPEP_0201637454 /NCGR_PEP_ID=MMETSP0493-20130528/12048_1 /ASSEMBLY_ACC=CAM_ASM_000838 /TAXON_ID=420259 /ORGANISM="Thalassiosira gravida, Strain GMp14c1" /LENGTH=38 /DNA_ID= /DNA_START= /DNA_END= /DNA_ORIENTATION=
MMGYAPPFLSEFASGEIDSPSSPADAAHASTLMTSMKA